MHNGGSATIRNNEFLKNEGQAINFAHDSGGTVENNNFDQNDMNLEVIQSSQDIMATGNWWGTSNRAIIESLIWDKRDKSTNGLVTYDPFADEPLVLDTPK